MKHLVDLMMTQLKGSKHVVQTSKSINVGHSVTIQLCFVTVPYLQYIVQEQRSPIRDSGDVLNN
jgi:hypothetical protein